MGIISSIINSYKRSVEEKNAACDLYISKIEKAMNSISNMFSDKQKYMQPSQKNDWIKSNSALLNELELNNISRLKSAKNYAQLLDKRTALYRSINDIDRIISAHNVNVQKVKASINEKNKICNKYISDIDSAISSIENIFSNKRSYIDPSAEKEFYSYYGELLYKTKQKNITWLDGSARYPELVYKQNKLHKEAGNIGNNIAVHNIRAKELKIQDAYNVIGNIEGKRLDEQQIECILKESHNHLVVAGAGTGKTTTVIGKIKYMLKSDICQPEDILVLSFTNASASEMKQRINAETGFDIEALTFHKLGLNIITEVDGIVPKITQLNLKKFIKEQIIVNMQNPEYLSMLTSYILFSGNISRSEFDFENQNEYNEYLQLNPPVTIKNESVKSYGELDIANFLTQNGIDYIYEEPYKIDTRTNEYGQYKPDFYLPEYDIYIEYFGINRKGEVPSYFSGSGGMTASQKYRASMDWKRKLHKENNTVMIECYSYEKFEGNLLENLKKKLTAKNVKLNQRDIGEVWEQVTEDNDSILDGIIRLFETVINLIKSNGYSIVTLQKLNVSIRDLNNSTFLKLLEPIYNSYCSYLKDKGEIDFNDMINVASYYAEKRKYISPYKYVIVDEYQDISKARFSLLYNMRKTNDFDLFCVGDDWQSIYRFAGSDIGYTINFEKYWGKSEISKIETTYRFEKSLIEVSGKFIMKNPMQITKNIIGKADEKGFPLGEICGYTEEYAIKFMTEKLSDLPKNSTVFFIGRYSFDVNLLHQNDILECKYNNVSGFVDVSCMTRPDLKMNFLTAHRSKGLQADYVFIINNKKSRMGFPSRIQDASILKLLLDKCDKFPYAEERRLYYVSLTRAKKKVFVVTVKGQESVFIEELRSAYGNRMKKERFECPLCGGKLIKRSGPYGEFLGCYNYRTTGCTYKKNIKSAT